MNTIRTRCKHLIDAYDQAQQDIVDLNETETLIKECPLLKQIGGNHYKDLPIQVVEYCHKNHIGYKEGCVIKYVTRWRQKGGIEDLEKAKVYLNWAIERVKKRTKQWRRISRISI